MQPGRFASWQICELQKKITSYENYRKQRWANWQPLHIHFCPSSKPSSTGSLCDLGCSWTLAKLHHCLYAQNILRRGIGHARNLSTVFSFCKCHGSFCRHGKLLHLDLHSSPRKVHAPKPCLCLCAAMPPTSGQMVEKKPFFGTRVG